MTVNGVLSQLTDPQDGRDRQIHEEFMGLFMLNDMSRKMVEFHADKKTVERVYGHWLNTGICLLKASAHIRNFQKLLEAKRDEFQKGIDPKSAVDQQKFYWDLSVEVEGALTQLKAALDSFALVIGAALKIKGVDGWHKKDGFSGQNIINTLNRNLNKEDLKKVKDLIDFLEDNKETLTKIVVVRDYFIHPKMNFMDFVTGFYYDKAKKEVIEPAIAYDDKGMLQSQFIEQAFSFVFDVLTTSGQLLLQGIAPGMLLGRKDGNYAWFIDPAAIAKDEDTQKG